MKVTVLGCGPSGGVPLIGNNWGVCDPANPRNRRLRVSVLIEKGGTVLLVDTSPDMREQLLACNLKRLDAVLITHAHADHCHGIDELRSINWLTQKPVDLYADKKTLRSLVRRFDYIFERKQKGRFFGPSVTPHVIEGPLALGGIAVRPFIQGHGDELSLGLRFDDFAYSTDVKELDETAFATLAGVKVWVVDCISEKPHRTHSHLEQTLYWIERLKPEVAYLTHMNETLDYADLAAKLPAGVHPAHDQLVIEC